MFVQWLPIVLFYLTTALEAAISSFDDLDISVDKAATELWMSSISGLSSQFSKMSLKEQASDTDSKRPLLPPFEISKQMNELIGTISTLDTKTAVEMIEKKLGRILASGACLHDIAPTIGSLPIEAKELVLAAIEKKAYTLLKLLQKAYIWRDERQHHWFMALSYGSPWYDKEMWEDLNSFPLDWRNNLWAVCEMENVALAAMLKEKALRENFLEDFEEKLLRFCIEYDAVKIFESGKFDPARLKEYFELLVKNSSSKLLQLYQTRTKTEHLHLEEFSFPEKLPASVDSFKFLMDNGYSFFPMNKLIEEFCKGGRLDLLKHLQELNPLLVPNLHELRYAAEKNFVNILDWGRRFSAHDFSYQSICKTLLIKRHFDTLYWWINVNGISVSKEAVIMIAGFGAVKVLQWVDKRHSGMCGFQEVSNLAAWNQRILVLKWLYKRHTILPCVEYLKNATGEILTWIKSKSRTLKDPLVALRLNGSDLSYKQLISAKPESFELLQWVFKNAPLSVFDTSREALSKNIKNKETMVWLYEKLKICPSDMRWIYAAGDLEAIKWAAENCNVYPTERNSINAAKGGHFHIITWIHKTVYPMNPSCLGINALRAAIATGNLEIAEYLVRNVFPEAKIKVSMGEDICAEKHLAALKWVYARGFSICQLEAEISVAAKHENIQVLEWLSTYLEDYEPVLGLWWNSLPMNNLHKSYRWLLERYPRMRQPKELLIDACRAYKAGSLRILKVLYDKDPLLLRSLPRNQTTKENYHIHQWLTAMDID